MNKLSHHDQTFARVNKTYYTVFTMNQFLSLLFLALLTGCIFGPESRSITLPAAGSYVIYAGQPVQTPADVILVSDVAGGMCPQGAGFCPETPYSVLERNGQRIIATATSGDLWFLSGDLTSARREFQWLEDATGHQVQLTYQI